MKGRGFECVVRVALRNCKRAWWKALEGLTLSNLKERKKCEVREIADCFAAAKEKCVGFDEEKCLVMRGLGLRKGF